MAAGIGGRARCCVPRCASRGDARAFAPLARWLPAAAIGGAGPRAHLGSGIACAAGAHLAFLCVGGTDAGLAGARTTGASVRATCVAGAGFALAAVFTSVFRLRSVGAHAVRILCRRVVAAAICGTLQTARASALVRRAVGARVMFQRVLGELIETRRRTSLRGAPQQEPQAARACERRVQGGPFHAGPEFVHALLPAVKPSTALAHLAARASSCSRRSSGATPARRP
jgi:hypothetical protein